MACTQLILPQELEDVVFQHLEPTLVFAIMAQAVNKTWQRKLWSLVPFDASQIYPLGRFSDLSNRYKIICELTSTLAAVRLARIDARFGQPVDNQLFSYCRLLSSKQITSLVISHIQGVERDLFGTIAASTLPSLVHLQLDYQFKYNHIDLEKFSNLRQLEIFKLVSTTPVSSYTRPAHPAASADFLKALRSNLTKLHTLEITTEELTELRRFTTLTSLCLWHLWPELGKTPKAWKELLPPGVGLQACFRSESIWDLMHRTLLQTNTYEPVAALIESGFDCTRGAPVDVDIPDSTFHLTLGLKFGRTCVPLGCGDSPRLPKPSSEALDALLELAPVQVLAPRRDSKGRWLAPLETSASCLWSTTLPPRTLELLIAAVQKATKFYTLDQLFGVPLVFSLHPMHLRTLREVIETDRALFALAPKVGFDRHGCPISHKLYDSSDIEQFSSWKDLDSRGRTAIQCMASRQRETGQLAKILLKLSDADFAVHFTPFIFGTIYFNHPEEIIAVVKRLAAVVPKDQRKEFVTVAMHLQLRLNATFSDQFFITMLGKGTLTSDPESASELRLYAQEALFEKFDPWRWLDLVRPEYRTHLFVSTPSAVNRLEKYLCLDPSTLSEEILPLVDKYAKNAPEWRQYKEQLQPSFVKKLVQQISFWKPT